MREAVKVIPGGVNSPVRAYGAVGMTPPFICRGEGSKIYDVDRNEYIDYVGSWGPLILGHRHPAVTAAIEEAVGQGISFGAPTLWETELAEMICEAVPGIEMVRLVNSGTEACMSAMRLARGVTGRSKMVKFKGCYHGHGDSFLVEAGSGAATFGVPSSPGVPESLAAETVSLPYNDIEAVRRLFELEGGKIAAVIVEPVAGNMGCVPPERGFLEGLRELTEKQGALLIFDEVMTGFRVSYGGAQELFGVIPDITCLGKIIGGGLPVGAFGGKKEIMQHLAPVGPVYQAGTLSGNPLAVRAGIATLKILREEGVYETLEQKVSYLEQGFLEAATMAGVQLQFYGVGAMFSIFFTRQRVRDFDTAAKGNNERFKVFFRQMLQQGIYLAPSPFEACFVSTAHSDSDIEKTVEASYRAFMAAGKVKIINTVK